jgi:large-conductance mechanosensitive channel
MGDLKRIPRQVNAPEPVRGNRMGQEKNVSTKHLIVGIIIGVLVGTVFGGIVKLFNLDIDTNIVLILIMAIAFGSFWLYLKAAKKHEK